MYRYGASSDGTHRDWLVQSYIYIYIYIIALALPVRIIIEFYQEPGTIPGNCSAHRASRACVRESMPLILGAILHLLVTTSTPAKRRAAHGTSRLSRNRKAHLVEIASERFPTYSTLGQYQPRLPWMQRPEFSKDESPVRCPPKHAIHASDRPHLRVPPIVCRTTAHLSRLTQVRPFLSLACPSGLRLDSISRTLAMVLRRAWCLSRVVLCCLR